MDKDAAVAALVTTPAGGRNAGAASSLLPCFPSQSQVPASCASTGASLRAEWILHEEMSANRTGLIRSNTEVSPFHNAPELLFIFFCFITARRCKDISFLCVSSGTLWGLTVQLKAEQAKHRDFFLLG